MELPADALLLSTKLKIPAPRKDFVARRALYAELSHCAEKSVVFVCGPAGTGKTMLLSTFLREMKLPNVSWLSLDESNTNVYSFWLYFTAAVGPFLENGEELLSLMRANPDATHMEGLLTVLVNWLSGKEDCYLVLDDVHHMKDETLLRTFEFFFGAMPENFHLFMLSREDPPVYLGPLAVSGRLLFIDGMQMRLSDEEGLTFLRQTLKLPGGDAELRELNDYAEGWIGGLQLAAAAGASGKCPPSLLRMGGGIAAEYLSREVFESLTAQEQEFLLCTGFLSYFDTEVCAGILDGFTKSRFDDMVEILMRKNLFLVCLDEKAGVYRYHNILSEYLTGRFKKLPEARQKALFQKAALAFAARGDLAEAMREYSQANDWDGVLNTAHAMGGSTETWGYLDKVPVDRLILDEDLSMLCLMYDYGSMRVERCKDIFFKFQERYGDTDAFRVMRFAEFYLTNNKRNLPQYEVLTAAQIEQMHFSSVTKALILIENAVAMMAHTKYEEAEESFHSAIRTCAGANTFVDFLCYEELAQLYEEVGRLNDSLNCYVQAKRVYSSPSRKSMDWFHYNIGITGVYMRRMELDKAQQVLTDTAVLLEGWLAQPDIVNVTYVEHLAEIKFLRGDVEGGVACTEKLLADYPNFSLLTCMRPIHELACAGKLSDALADRFLREQAEAGTLEDQPYMRLLRARILFERDEKVKALQETDSLLTFTRKHQSWLHLVEADLQKIWMLTNSNGIAGNQREIGNLLREAVYYAHRDRILMPFFLDRRTLLPLLRALSAQSAGKDAPSAAECAFIAEAISVCAAASSQKETETLSARELDVLRELELGITNREIAERLCISQATVKTHILNIYAKLGVSSRVMAVAKAKKLGIE